MAKVEGCCFAVQPLRWKGRTAGPYAMLPRQAGTGRDDKSGGSLLSFAAVMVDGQSREDYQSGDVRKGRLA